MTEGHCEAPNHVEGCNGQLTDDHFTPKVIMKAWGVKQNREQRKANIQKLSPACHIDKDRDTAFRAEVLKFQLGGGMLTFEQHRAVFERGRLHD